MDTRSPESAGYTHQALFHQRWHHLRDRHVRDLAWLLDAPDLLDPDASQWEGKIASLPHAAADRASAWLRELDAAPAEFHASLEIGRYTRLGRYAEKLMAFYFRKQGMLAAHGLQVRTQEGDTIGEFDFLLQDAGALLHWELATKFYLLAEGRSDIQADYFVGPNLADTLQAKMQKILRRQLALGTHPAARLVLPGPIAASRAFIKGWLFAPPGYGESFAAAGVSVHHCRGRWLPHEAFAADPALRYSILPRLRWLAPAQMEEGETVCGDTLLHCLTAHFHTDDTPVMVAVLSKADGFWQEAERIFVVPTDWRARALERSTRKEQERLGRASVPGDQQSGAPS